MSDLISRQFGRLTVIDTAGVHTSPGGTKKKMWLCQCECGNITRVNTSNLLNGTTKSCGCMKYEKIKMHNTTHGGSHDRLYGIWKSMKRRCNNSKDKSYKYYGGTGIKVCKEWADDYSVFREWAYKNGYDKNAKPMECTIDRIDPYKDYMPDNCRWVDMFEQNKDSHKRKGIAQCI